MWQNKNPAMWPGYWMTTMEREDGKVGAGETAARDETSVWLFEEWEKLRERDQAALAALHARVDAIIAEGVVKFRRTTLEQQDEGLQSLCQSMRQKARDLQALLPDSPVAQGLLADLDALAEAIGKRP